MGGLRLILADWASLEALARPVRIAVFLEEQAVPEDMEWDEFDAVSRHVVVLDARDKPVATGRLLPDGHIGRMAVMMDFRGRGIGRQVLVALMAEARRMEMPELRLHAQTHAMSFYEKAGFQPEGPEFMEAGIPHVMMVRQLQP